MLNKKQYFRIRRILSSAIILALIFTPAAFMPTSAASDIPVGTSTELINALKSGSSGDVITLTSDITVDGVSTASLKRSITIDGNGHTIDAKNLTSPLIKSNGYAVALRNLTIKNNKNTSYKYSGGAVSLYKTTLTAENCSFINNSYAYSNKSGGGGAIAVGGSGVGKIHITNSTFYGNTSTYDGGAVYSSSAAGTIINSTITGSSAAQKGGGVRNSSTTAANQVVLYNSIAVGNTATSGSDVYRTDVDGGYNIIGGSDNVGEDGTSIYEVTNYADWLDSEPKDNGGLTPTIALLDHSDSPAVDLIPVDNEYLPDTDQRGVKRPLGNGGDAGAYEAEEALVAKPTASPAGGAFTSTQQVTLSCITDDVEIYYTIDGSEPDQTSNRYQTPISVGETMTIKARAYNAQGDYGHVLTQRYVFFDQNSDTVKVTNGQELDDALSYAVPGSTISIESDIADAITSATIGNDLIIEGNGHTIDASGSERTLFRSIADLTIRNLTIENGKNIYFKYGGGAAAVYQSKLTIENCSFIGNEDLYAATSSDGGGAISVHNANGYLSVTNSTFYNNYAVIAGGAISSKGPGEIINSTIVGNKTDGKGGGMRNKSTASSSQVVLYNSIVLGNTAADAASGHDVYRAASDGGYNIIGEGKEVSQNSTSRYNVTNYSAWLDDAPRDNGGLTPTIALLENSESMAIDMIPIDHASLASTDQRGVPRPQGEGGDVGAYEMVSDAIVSPVASPKGGTYEKEQTVSLNAYTEGSVIYYTLNGEDPDYTSALYTEPIEIMQDTTLKAVAYLDGEYSGVRTEIYVIKPAAPTANPGGGTYYEEQYIALSSTDGAAVYYTLDGSLPSDSSTLYDGRIFIEESAALKAIAYRNGVASDISTINYIISDEEEGVTYVSSGTELDKAISNASKNSVIRLKNDIDAITSSTYSAKTLTIDGNGYTINGNDVTKTALRFKGSGNNITIKNLTMRNMRSQLSYGGGAVGVYKGSLTVENCGFINNTHTGSKYGGGAVFAQTSGTLNVTNSTFYGNITGGKGGAIYSPSNGGEIINCTVAANTAGSNGGGVYSNSSSAMKLYNNIIVGNKVGNSSNDVYQGTDSGGNLLGVVSSISGSLSPKGISNTGWMAESPADNGGNTLTMALLEVADSPAVDSGVASKAPVKDQRGVFRDDLPDIGAYELEKGPVIVVDAVTRASINDNDEQTVEAVSGEAFEIEYTLYYTGNDYSAEEMNPENSNLSFKVDWSVSLPDGKSLPEDVDVMGTGADNDEYTDTHFGISDDTGEFGKYFAKGFTVLSEEDITIKITGTSRDNEGVSASVLVDISAEEPEPGPGPDPEPAEPEKPVIKEQPASQSVTEGTTVILAVDAEVSDGGELSYQWYSSDEESNIGGIEILGADESIYSPPTSETGTYYYYVIVTNTLDKETAETASEVAVIEVTDSSTDPGPDPGPGPDPEPAEPQEPVIKEQPVNRSVTRGAAVTLSVAAEVEDGGELSYQWYRSEEESCTGGTEISGADESTYSPSTASTGIYYYYVIVTNTLDGDTAETASEVAVITVSSSSNGGSGGGSSRSSNTENTSSDDETADDETGSDDNAAGDFGSSSEENGTKAADFADISDTDWYYNAVSKMIGESLFSGTGNGEFSPNTEMTRGMFVTVVGRLAEKSGLDISGSTEFVDVASAQYYSKYVSWAADKGIVMGYEGGIFGPDDNITREQMAVMLVRYMQNTGLELPEAVELDFSDGAAISQWAEESVAIATAAGLINGYEDGSFGSKRTATRAEVAQIFANYLNNMDHGK